MHAVAGLAIGAHRECEAIGVALPGKLRDVAERRIAAGLPDV